MALHWEHTGTNPDGTPHFTVSSDSESPNFLLTGPDSSGVLTTADGTSYDVSPLVVETASQEHAEDLAKQIDEQVAAKVEAV